MMTTISDSDRAEAMAMSQLFYGSGVRRTPSDGSVRRWLAVRDHVLAAHECPTVPAWRPVIHGEDLTSYEVRSRGRDRDVWHTWGVAARRRDRDGLWVTERGWRLDGWSVVETTAPLPELEPWPEGVVDAVAEMLDEVCEPHESYARALLDTLAARHPGVRAAITGGER